MMLDAIRDYCLALKGVTEHTPFDDRTLVLKVMDKMFCITDLIDTTSITVKCDPERAVALREQYSQVREGYHTHKKLWNTVAVDEGLSFDFIKEQIAHSYTEVVKKLPKKTQLALELL